MLSEHAKGVVVDTWVIPGASRSEIVGVHSGALRIRVAAAPEKGKANAAAAQLLSAAFGGAGAELVSGASSRRKRFLLRSTTVEEVRRALEALGVEFSG